MKSEKVFQAIGQISDEKIAEANIRPAKIKHIRHPWVKWVSVATAVAACLAVALTLVLNQGQPADFSGLPKLTVSNMSGESMGFEGHLAYSVDELSNGNPWTENTVLETLPVFRNPGGHDGLVRTFFDDGEPLPEQYYFHYDSTEQQAIAALNYLLEQYADVVNMKAPALDLFMDYTYYGQKLFPLGFSAFENEGDITDRILSYNFNRVKFAPDDDGRLMLIDRYHPDLSQRIGDYPIITALEARELLLQMRYITTVPEELPGEEYIAHVELIYRTSEHDTFFMPYYRFLVELPTMQRENGLKQYGAFYVPAVGKEFLVNMPLWDGGFN